MKKRKKIRARVSLAKHPPEVNLSHEEIKRMPAYIPEDALFETDFLDVVISSNGKKNGKPQFLHRSVDETAILLLDMKGKCFEEKKESACAIEAFIIAHRAGVYPPMWALDYIAQVFSDWHKLKGEKKLDDLFELNTQRGQRKAATYFERGERGRRDFELCKDVLALRCIFGLTIKQASCIVSTSVDRAADTIEDIYKKGYGKTFKGNDWDALRQVFSNYSVEKKIKLLKRFPLQTKDLPSKIQKWLSGYNQEQLKKWGMK